VGSELQVSEWQELAEDRPKWRKMLIVWHCRYITECGLFAQRCPVDQPRSQREGQGGLGGSGGLSRRRSRFSLERRSGTAAKHPTSLPPRRLHKRGALRSPPPPGPRPRPQTQTAASPCAV
jgi:hypothetical protein